MTWNVTQPLLISLVTTVTRDTTATKSIRKAIAKASEKYPKDALQVNDDNLADVQAHYGYLADHDALNEKLDALKQIGVRALASY